MAASNPSLSIRIGAVYAVRSLGRPGPESVSRLFKGGTTCLYHWLKRPDEGGYAALNSGPRGSNPPWPSREALGRGWKPLFKS
jgi:hypothetical protein